MTPLLSLIPRPLAQLLIDHPDRPPLELERTFAGAVLFADIAGFTALSDTLAASGPRGIEELTGLLNRLFAGLIARVEAFGGEVWGFGGDALTAIFPLADDDPAAGARRAAACAWAMQRETVAAPPLATSAGAFPLSMAIGLA
ncbi:MAG TPA: hypothetical protein VGE07_12340, partial [Herpetosiphonaceae bacterium]